MNRLHRTDHIATAVGAALLIAAVTTGLYLNWHGHSVQAATPPLYATWMPHLGLGTPLALAVAGVVIWFGPALAHRLRWTHLLIASYLASLAWIVSLALVDGWHWGVAGRLTTPSEYLREVGGITDIPAMLRDFTSRIVDHQPDSWAEHVSGHPPAATLIFVWLDRLGLGGGGPAALFCMLCGALAAVAIPVAVRRLRSEPAARVCALFTVLFPGAVWLGVSADAVFTGVTSAGLALLACALTSRGPWARVLYGLSAGLLLGFGCYLSYGLTLIALIALAVIFSAVRRADGTPVPVVKPLLAAAAGFAGVVVAFTVAGFWWLDGYHQIYIRYYQGIASHREYAYWVWADLAGLLCAAGLAMPAIVVRAFRSRVWLVIGAVGALVVADLSGLSKAEVERIWLPFAVWLMAGADLLPRTRGWLAAQAAVALLVNHLLFTVW